MPSMMGLQQHPAFRAAAPALTCRDSMRCVGGFTPCLAVFREGSSRRQPLGRSRASRGFPSRFLSSVSARASRDPDRVSTLSADEAALAPAESSAQSLQQQLGNVVQDRGSSTQVQSAPSARPQGSSSSTTNALVDNAPTTSSSTSAPSSAQPDSSSSSSSGQQHHTKSFGVTVSQLQQLVQAGVDESQADAAAGLIRALSQQLQVKQQQRKQHKSAHKANGADSSAAVGSSSSLSSITFPDSSSSNGRTSTSNGAAAAAADSTASSSLAVLPRALASALGSSLSKGLPGSEADTSARVAAFGSNSLAAAATSSFWQLLLEAASDSTLLLLMAAGAVSLGLAASTGKEAMDFIDGAAILASVAICVTVTAVTNYQKEAKFRQLNSLKENIPVSAGCCWVMWVMWVASEA